MMATRRSRLRATRRLAKTWILRRLPKTRSRSTRMMATRRSRLTATRRLAKTRILRTKMMATRPSEQCWSSTAQHRPNRQVTGAVVRIIKQEDGICINVFVCLCKGVCVHVIALSEYPQSFPKNHDL